MDGLIDIELSSRVVKYTNTTHRAYAKYHESEMQRRRGRAALRTTGLIVVPCRGISRLSSVIGSAHDGAPIIESRPQDEDR